MAEPIITQILRLISEEGPLSPVQICQKLNIKRGTIAPLISILRQLGLTTYYVTEHGAKLQGIYVITDYGKQCPALKKEEKR